MERLNKQLEFILEADKLKNIYRQTYISDGSRKENDSEHSWHLALMCILLKEYANEEIDLLKTMTMVLIHDIVEIDAGDTYAYDNHGHATKRKREEAAADRLFSILPADQATDFRNIWEEFEAGETPEASFALALDKMQPLLLNDKTDGISWKEHGISREQIVKRNEPTTRGSRTLWERCIRIIDKNVSQGNILI